MTNFMGFRGSERGNLEYSLVLCSVGFILDNLVANGRIFYVKVQDVDKIKIPRFFMSVYIHRNLEIFVCLIYLSWKFVCNSASSFVFMIDV